jgi:tRNA-uridine 2-sulfurtransferase
VQYFIDEYLKGRTPFPCAYCNPEMKFKYLVEYADKENCEYIATGHYVKTGLHEGKKYLFQGDDPDKDQTFFLWGLQRNIVDRLLFPLGEFQKSEIRSLANENGFVKLSKKKDSLGVCFIEGNNYRNFLKKRGIKSKPGNFIDHNNRILGQHSGITNYTIGQRRGLGINLNFPVFVSEIRLDDNEIVLAKYEDLYRNKIIIKDYYFIDKEVFNNVKTWIVKVRYRLQETPCRLHILDESRAEVELLESEAMISPGQTAVFYDDNRLVGGGFIESAE